MDDIDEQAEIMLIDKKGNKLDLNEEQLAYLHELGRRAGSEEPRVP